MITKYNEYIKESYEPNSISDIIENILMKNVPTIEILNFKDNLASITLNESITSKLFNLKYKFRSWFDDKLFKYLINRKKKFYTDLVDRLCIFDLTNLDNVYKHFPVFELNSIYLAGGMDAAVDVGKGWRERLEYEFEIVNKSQESTLPIIEISGMEVHPNHVVDSTHLIELLEHKNPKKYLKLYKKPAILNPVRKEIEREADTFNKMYGKLKEPEYDPNIDIEPVEWLSKTFTGSIEPDDENLLRISDAVFLGQDQSAGAGTYGELELLSLIRKPLFAWLVNLETNKVGALKLWNYPHLSKIARNEDEMKILVKTLLTK